VCIYERRDIVSLLQSHLFLKMFGCSIEDERTGRTRHLRVILIGILVDHPLRAQAVPNMSSDNRLVPVQIIFWFIATFVKIISPSMIVDWIKGLGR